MFLWVIYIYNTSFMALELKYGEIVEKWVYIQTYNLYHSKKLSTRPKVPGIERVTVIFPPLEDREDRNLGIKYPAPLSYPSRARFNLSAIPRSILQDPMSL